MNFEDFKRLLAGMDFKTDEIDGDTVLGDDGIGIDSLYIMELVLKIEEQYGLVIDQDDFQKIQKMTVEEFLTSLVK